jgi:hypothetical protein
MHPRKDLEEVEPTSLHLGGKDETTGLHLHLQGVEDQADLHPPEDDGLFP